MKTRNGIKYRVWWYGYKPVNDTYEQASNIPTHFVHRYRKREAKQTDRRIWSKRVNNRSQKNGKHVTRGNKPGTWWRSPRLHPSVPWERHGENGYRLRICQAPWDFQTHKYFLHLTPVSLQGAERSPRIPFLDVPGPLGLQNLQICFRFPLRSPLMELWDFHRYRLRMC